MSPDTPEPLDEKDRRMLEIARAKKKATEEARKARDEAAGSARMNISIPVPLKEEIDKAPESISWSAVAAKAFEDKLQELKAHRKAKTWREAMERLRAVAEFETRVNYRSGLEAGSRWFMEKATPKQLARLEEKFGEGNRAVSIKSFVDSLTKGKEDISVAIGRLISGVDFGIFPSDNPFLDSTDFWQEILGRNSFVNIFNPDFAKGFLTAALEGWVRAKKEMPDLLDL